MKRYASIALIILGFSLLAACQPSPKEVAEAEKIKTEASIQATQAALEAERTKLELERDRTRTDAYNEGVKEAQKNVNVKIKEVIDTLGKVMIWTMSVCIVCGAGFLLYTFLGMSHAAVKAADIRAVQVAVDRKTRLLPVMIAQDKQGNTFAVNLNNGMVQPMTQASLPVPSLVKATHHIQAIGVATEAVKDAASSLTTHGNNYQALDTIGTVAESVPMLSLGEEDNLPPTPAERARLRWQQSQSKESNPDNHGKA